MSRAKSYQNLQKSVQSASTSQGVAQPLSTTESTPSHLDDTPQLVSFFQPTPSVQAAAHQTASVRAPSVRAAAQLDPSVQAASQPTQSKKRPGRKCPQHWTIDAIDMPRVKRYQNLQKSVQPAHSVQATSQPAPSVRAAAQPSHSVQATSQPAPSVRAATKPAHSVQATSQPAPSVRAAAQPTQFKKRHGRECPQHWTIDAIGAHLQDLDAADYEESPAIPFNIPTEGEFGSRPSYAGSGEILDEMITRSRGEVKRINSPKITSSTATPIRDSKLLQSPRVPEKVYSLQISKLRSPLSGGRGPFSPRNGEPKPSNLGMSPRTSTSND